MTPNETRARLNIFLQSIAQMAVGAQQALAQNDFEQLWDDLSDIERGLKTASKLTSDLAKKEEV